MSKQTQSPMNQEVTAEQLEAQIEQEASSQDKLNNNNQINQQNELSAPGSGGDQLLQNNEENEIERNNTQNAQRGSSNAGGGTAHDVQANVERLNNDDNNEENSRKDEAAAPESLDDMQQQRKIEDQQMKDDDSQSNNKQLLQEEHNAAADEINNQNQGSIEKYADADSDNQIVEESNTKLDNIDRDNTSVEQQKLNIEHKHSSLVDAAQGAGHCSDHDHSKENEDDDQDDNYSEEENDIFDNQDQNMHFYKEYCRLYYANIILTNRLQQLLDEKQDLGYKLNRLESNKRNHEIVLNMPFEIDNEKKKRHRRTATEIARHYKCPIEDCPKSYGSEGSLNQHIKLKHPEYYQEVIQQNQAQQSMSELVDMTEWQGAN